MKCTEFEKLINEYIDEELSELKSEDVKKHLNECNNCKEIYEELVELKSMLSNLEELELPEGFEDELHLKLESVADEMKTKSKVVFFQDRFKKYKVLASIAAVVLISVLAIKASDLSFDKSSRDEVASDYGSNEMAVNSNNSSEAVAESFSMDDSTGDMNAEDADEALAVESSSAMTERAYSKSAMDIVSTDESVTLEVRTNSADINEYITTISGDYNIRYEEEVLNSSDIILYVEDSQVESFINNLKAKFVVIEEFYVDNLNSIENMKLALDEYESQIKDLEYQLENAVTDEEKQTLKENINYFTDLYEEIKINLELISRNDGYTSIKLIINSTE